MTTASEAVAAIAAETWDAVVDREAYCGARVGRKVARISSGSLSEAEAVAAAASDRLANLKMIDTTQLSRTERLTVAYLRYWLEDEREEPRRWWTGFGVTPYNSSYLSMLLPIIFARIDLKDSRECERYVQLVGDYAGLIEAHRDRLIAQADRGWRIPKPALPGVRVTLAGIAKSAALALIPSVDRGADDSTAAAIRHLVEGRLTQAFEDLQAALGTDYQALAPDEVGLMHLPGGDEAYRFWVRYHLSHDADPNDIHEIGLSEVAKLTAEMAELRASAFGYHGGEASFHEMLRQDPRAKAATPEALETTYRRHLDRMAPVFATLVRKAPRSQPTVRRLAPELEAGMTFGYYEAPHSPGADGVYIYSGNGIPDRLQLNAAPLIFHELVPGHHVHITRQSENHELPAIRRQTFQFSAFNEGWAEYSAGLAEEAGLYEDPYDLYGWLSHQRFVAQRLVVDTGLNALGWSLDQAREFMAANTLESAPQIVSETLRYATDMPAQALAYRMGFLKFRELRQRARKRLGDRFDLADFHEAILEQGALPIEVLEESIDSWAEETLRANR